MALLTGSWLPLPAAAAAVPAVRRLLERRKHRAEAERREAAVIGFCGAVAAELRVGRSPEAALLAVGVRGLGGAGASVSAAARFAGDVPAALRQASERPGAQGLAGIAACWQVAVRGGAGLADGLDRVALALRAERDQREEVRAQLAGPRATALLLALLPLFGLLLGGAMGANPVDVLLHSPPGWALLTGAVALEVAGLLWVGRIIRSAEEPGRRPGREDGW